MLNGNLPTNTSEDYRIVLPQSRIPTAWYNILADMPVPMPAVLHPGTHQPIGPADLSVLFPMELIKQEVSSERYIPIPDEVRDIYRLWRPTPLIRAVRLEKALDTPAHIYYKNESVSPSGSHKLNTAVPQAYYNKQEGIQSISTETGAGQWGCALAIAGDMFKMAIDIYMVKISYQQKPYRRSVMQAYGATVTPSPSDHTAAGRMILERNPNSTGSLGIAISEAVEVAATSGGKTKYSLGSVLNHVLLHQTVIGQEALDAMTEIGEYPDVVIGCVGGGSNFAGIAFPFLHKTLTEGVKTKFLAIEPSSCPTLTRGTYTYDFGDTAGLDPAGQDVHPGPRLRAGVDPRRRPALSRHVPDHLDPGECRLHRAARLRPEPVLRGGHHVRPQRGDHPRAGEQPRHSRRDRRGAGRQGDGREEGDPVQPVRPRPLRHGRL